MEFIDGIKDWINEKLSRPYRGSGQECKDAECKDAEDAEWLFVCPDCGTADNKIDYGECIEPCVNCDSRNQRVHPDPRNTGTRFTSEYPKTYPCGCVDLEGKTGGEIDLCPKHEKELHAKTKNEVNWKKYLGHSLRQEIRRQIGVPFRRAMDGPGIDLVLRIVPYTIGIKKWAGLCSAHGGEKKLNQKIRDTYNREKRNLKPLKQRYFTSRGAITRHNNRKNKDRRNR